MDKRPINLQLTRPKHLAGRFTPFSLSPYSRVPALKEAYLRPRLITPAPLPVRTGGTPHPIRIHRVSLDRTTIVKRSARSVSRSPARLAPIAHDPNFNPKGSKIVKSYKKLPAVSPYSPPNRSAQNSPLRFRSRRASDNPGMTTAKANMDKIRQYPSSPAKIPIGLSRGTK